MKWKLSLAAIALIVLGIVYRVESFRSDDDADARTIAPAQGRAVAADAPDADIVAPSPRTGDATRAGLERGSDTEAPAVGVERRIRKLDEALLAETTDPAWAAPLESRIQRLLVPAGAGDDGLVAPQSHKATCYRRTCRIAMQYRNAIDAELMAQRLPLELGDALTYGVFLPRHRADGSVELNVWLSTQPLE